MWFVLRFPAHCMRIIKQIIPVNSETYDILRELEYVEHKHFEFDAVGLRWID